MLKQFLSEILRMSNSMIYDNSIIMAIIAINMTVIGLTSLADAKSIIGVDYGKFLINKFKFLGIRMYYWLITFALINIASLFIMFIEISIVRLINFLLLLLSLIFAIFYFFRFIIIENKWVKEQILKSELLGLYCDGTNTEHLYIDKLVNMNPGNRTSNRLSTNIINYFNNFNGDTQKIFIEVFGPESLIYSDKNKIVKYREKHFGIKRYNYRVSSTDAKIKEISFEFFQLFRYCEMQDKWAIDILRIMNGEPNTYKSYDVFRLYNLARVIVHIATLGSTENLHKYKFVLYIKDFLYSTVDITKNQSLTEAEKEHITCIEKYMMNSLVSYFATTIKIYEDFQFINCVQEFLNEIVLKDRYKGCLRIQEIVETFVDVSISLDCKKLQDIIEISLNEYYNRKEKERTCKLDIEKIKLYANNKLNKNKTKGISVFF